MARTTKEILEELNTEAEKHDELKLLQNNRSRVSMWNYTKQTVAFVAKTIEEMFDTHKQEVLDTITQQQIGSLSWYASQVRAFQYGEQLSIINNIPQYLTSNPSARIIKHVSITEGGSVDSDPFFEEPSGTLIVKVVKESKTGGLEPLDSDEQAALREYLRQIKFAGTRIVLVSEPADRIYLRASVTIDKQLIKQDGSAVRNSSIYPVEEAITAFFRQLPFNGKVYASAIEDTIQKVEGVRDARLLVAAHATATGSFSIMRVEKHTRSGHVQLVSGGNSSTPRGMGISYK